MSQPFSFPPPPPPPPKRDVASNTSVRGGQRGRGRLNGLSSRGPFPSSRGRGSQNMSHAQRGRGGSYNRSSAPAPKRDHTQAFGHQPQTRPRAPPAVPSFDVDIKALLPPKPQPANDKPPKRKSNALGLTPATQTLQSDSEDDADDEIKLARAISGDGITFEHNGQTLLLRTPAEIAAWIAERRKKFPTVAKFEAARKEADEKRKQQEEQKVARIETARLKREAQQQERNERERQRLKDKLIAAQVAKAKSAVAMSKEDIALKARQKADKLRKRAERATRELEEAEAALNRLDPTDSSSKPQEDGGEQESEVKSNPPSETDESDSEATSSSGSSTADTDRDSGSEPEESTSKRTVPDRVAPSKQPDPKTDPEVCTSFQRFGRCKFGKKCRYLHERKKRKKEQQQQQGKSTDPGRRKGLYQIMVEKEKEEEMKRAVKVIVALGQQGLLKEPPEPSKDRD